MKQKQYKTPGQLLQEDLARLGWNQRDIARALALDPSVVNKIIRDNQAITPDRARALAAVTGRDPREYWYAQCDLWFYTDAPHQVFARLVSSQTKSRRGKSR